MIDCFFTVGEVQIPAYQPSPEFCELLRLAGWDISDLCCITDHAGASRWLEAKVLIRREDLDALYADAPNPVELRWGSEGASPNIAYVHLMPPQPIFCTPNSPSVVLVTARDLRYLSVYNPTDEPATDLTAEGEGAWARFTPDGRWTINAANLTDPAAFTLWRQAIIERLPFVITADNGTYPTPLFNRFANMTFPPDTSMSMILDMILAGTGNVLIRSGATGTYQISDFKTLVTYIAPTDLTTLAGGTQSVAETLGSGTLQQMWNNWVGVSATLGDKSQYMRMPDTVRVSNPLRTVESQTTYQNYTGGNIGYNNRLRFSRDNEIASTLAMPASKLRVPDAQLMLREPRSGSLGMNVNGASVTVSTPNSYLIAASSPAYWDLATYQAAVRDLLAARLRLPIGKVMLAGWEFINQRFGLTQKTWTLGMRGTEMIPYTIVETHDDDWILGPDGRMQCDPANIAVCNGMVSVRRLWNGMQQVEVPAPMTRTFAAKITGAEQIGPTGSSAWRWLYTWEEVEPAPVQSPWLATMNFPHNDFERVGTVIQSTNRARNMAEAGNNFVAAGNPANVIAGGVRQSDYANATVSPLPISNGTIVMMCEQFLTHEYEATRGNSDFISYWFSMPNAVLTVCEEP